MIREKKSVNSAPCGGCLRARGEEQVRCAMVVQLENGWAVSDAGRRVRQCLRSTHTHARASTRTHAPTVHTPTHILMALHKHDHCTFLHLQADMCTSQRRERARRALQGTARLGGTDISTSRAATRPTTTSTSCCWALSCCFAKWWQERSRAQTVEPHSLRRLYHASIAAGAGAQITSRRACRTLALGSPADPSVLRATC